MKKNGEKVKTHGQVWWATKKDHQLHLIQRRQAMKKHGEKVKTRGPIWVEKEEERNLVKEGNHVKEGNLVKEEEDVNKFTYLLNNQQTV